MTLGIDHELRRDTSIGVDLGYSIDDYQEVDLTDKYFRVTPFVTFQLNRNFGAALRYDFTTKDSNEDESNREYDVNKLFLSITGTY
jgi:hypothetical protein